MISKEELKQYLLENCVDEYGDLKLNHLLVMKMKSHCKSKIF